MCLAGHPRSSGQRSVPTARAPSVSGGRERSAQVKNGQATAPGRRSTDSAAARPSPMARTTSDAPRTESPAANTPRDEVIKALLTKRLPRSSCGVPGRGRAGRVPRGGIPSREAQICLEVEFRAGDFADLRPPAASGVDQRTLMQRSFPTRPSRPTSSFAVALHSRSQPSSCDEEVRRISGQAGHGFCGVRSFGGSGRI